METFSVVNCRNISVLYNASVNIFLIFMDTCTLFNISWNLFMGELKDARISPSPVYHSFLTVERSGKHFVFSMKIRSCRVDHAYPLRFLQAPFYLNRFLSCTPSQIYTRTPAVDIRLSYQQQSNKLLHFPSRRLSRSDLNSFTLRKEDFSIMQIGKHLNWLDLFC